MRVQTLGYCIGLDTAWAAWILQAWIRHRPSPGSVGTSGRATFVLGQQERSKHKFQSKTRKSAEKRRLAAPHSGTGTARPVGKGLRGCGGGDCSRSVNKRTVQVSGRTITDTVQVSGADAGTSGTGPAPAEGPARSLRRSRPPTPCRRPLATAAPSGVQGARYERESVPFQLLVEELLAMSNQARRPPAPSPQWCTRRGPGRPAGCSTWAGLEASPGPGCSAVSLTGPPVAVTCVAGEGPKRAA